MRLRIYIWLMVLAVSFGQAFNGYGQTKSSLQSKKKKLQNDINYTNTLLKKNKKKQDASVKEIEKINTNIESRIELINSYSQEIGSIEQDINLNQSQIKKLEAQLAMLRKSYSKMVVQAWKTRSTTNTWMYI